MRRAALERVRHAALPARTGRPGIHHIARRDKDDAGAASWKGSEMELDRARRIIAVCVCFLASAGWHFQLLDAGTPDVAERSRCRNLRALRIDRPYLRILATDRVGAGASATHGTWLALR